MPIPPLNTVEYVALAGRACPVCACQPHRLSRGPLRRSAEAGRILETVCCLDCQARWTNVYDLLSYMGLTIEGVNSYG